VVVLWLSEQREENLYGLWRDGSLEMMNEVEGGRRAFYKQLEVEVVQEGKSKDFLKTRVNVDVVESKASRE
jgi:hypothetical protein